MFRYSRISSLGREWSEIKFTDPLPLPPPPTQTQTPTPSSQKHASNHGDLKHKIIELKQTLAHAKDALNNWKQDGSSNWKQDLFVGALELFEKQLEQYKLLFACFPDDHYYSDLCGMLRKAGRMLDSMKKRTRNRMRRTSDYFRNKLAKCKADIKVRTFHKLLAAARAHAVHVPTFPGEIRLEHVNQLKLLFSNVKSLLIMRPTCSKPIPVGVWKACVLNMFSALEILMHHPNLTCTTFMATGPNFYAKHEGNVQLRADLIEFLTRLYYEFDLSLKFIQPGTPAYQEKLKDECMLYLLFRRYCLLLYYNQDSSSHEDGVRLALLIIELIYYRSQADYDSLFEHANLFFAADLSKISTDPVPQPLQITARCWKVMDTFRPMVEEEGDAISALRALLCGVYFYAVNDKLSDAMRLLSCTDVRAKVKDSDRSTKILYNRAIAQLGLCAFKAGSVKSSYRLLSELYGQGRIGEHGKIEELLAQDASHNHSQETDSQHKMWEPMGQTPSYMSINLELLEAVHLLGAMILGDVKRKSDGHLTSKTGKWRSVSHPKGVLTDTIWAAAEALKERAFDVSLSIIKRLDLWKKVKSSQSEDIFDMIIEKMREESIRRYLVICSSSDYVPLDQLDCRFGLPSSKIKDIVGRMMKELDASWNKSGSCILFRNVESRSRKRKSDCIDDRSRRSHRNAE